MQDIRPHFPSLSRVHNGQKCIYLDGPAGTQVPGSVAAAITSYYENSNANTHGWFPSSRETDAVVDEARATCAVFLNAESADCISFGANMTSLAFKLSRAFSRVFEPGDEVVITQLDHEANRGPWIYLEKHGIKVHEIRLLPSGKLDYNDAAEKINEQTKLVAAGWGSNILGTVNDIGQLRKLTSAVNALLLVDAVHYAPHFSVDVQATGCDFLLCSAYKFYGPHVGVLYSKPGLLDTFETDRLRTAGQLAPERIETGTLNHAAIAGVTASIQFIADQGSGDLLRHKIETGFTRIGQHEFTLGERLWNGLGQIPGVRRYGVSFEYEQRCPTIAFSVDGKTPEELCRYLGDRGIFAWDGHFYAIRATEVLGLLEKGGVTRMGVVAYNTTAEIDRTLNAVNDFVNT